LEEASVGLKRGEVGLKGNVWVVHLGCVLLPFAMGWMASGCASHRTDAPIFATVPPGRLSFIEDLPVLYLEGSPYEIGYQHGSLMRQQVRASVRNAMAFADRQLGIPGLGRWIVRRKLDQAWKQMEPFVPPRYLEELKGLADGAGIPLVTLKRVHAIPDLTSVACASFAVSGSATLKGEMIHIRNLDWAIHSGIQDYAAILVVRPVGLKPFVNIGWLGFIGVITGINDRGISVAQIGAESADADLAGIPMPFLQRKVLEEADNLHEAVEIVRRADRTVGYNYLFADAQAKQAVALETTHSHCAVFWMGSEPEGPYVESVADAIFRSDFALDEQVRQRQWAARGQPDRAGLESPVGSSAYDIRYRGQAALLRRFHGAVDPEVAMAIARAIAPNSNIQSVVFAYPRLWVANAQGNRPAASQRYREIDLRTLFSVAQLADQEGVGDQF
jgi:isopenicillin-N N-acyltransferase-like protein